MAYTVKKVYESESKSPRTVVLWVSWVSWHSPLPAQIKALEEKLGSIEIYQMRGIIPIAELVVKIAKRLNASVIVPVLPLSMIARLAELAKQDGFTVLLAKMNAIVTTKTVKKARKVVQEKPESRTMATCADGTVRVFEFERFEKLIEVRLVTEPL